MKIKPKIIISIIALATLTFGLGCYGAMRGFITNPSYMKWALFGGDYRPDFIKCFFDDKFSQQIVDGKTVDELKKWFPKLRSENWVNDQMEKELNQFNADYQSPQREKEVYITGVDDGVGIFIQVSNDIATGAYLLKDIPNQRVHSIAGSARSE
jgi:hypothetical protein